ncbi:hypothetical protein [uncultured Amnibacterium sp.]|uniref:hypothetical protein n=1 Tax=uncultured Amnibacterium sp. TaxID=1631851 RepID=UPI0035C97F44
MPDLLGPVFISYRRKRIQETDALIHALHDRGLPTWRDVDDLDSEPTEETVRAVLKDGRTSGAILWLTPDVRDSAIVKNVEVPEAVRRYRRDKDFWLLVILADGLEYEEVTSLFGDSLGIEDLATWNLTKVSAPWASFADIRQIAVSALRWRVAKLAPSGLEAGVNLAVHAKGTMTFGAHDALALDWTRYFNDGVPECSGLGVDGWGCSRRGFGPEARHNKCDYIAN